MAIKEKIQFNPKYMKRWGQDALTYPKPITLIKCKWAKKTHNAPLFYILCCAQLIMTESQLDAQFHIEKKRKERDQLLWTWNRVEELNEEVGLSEETYKELQAKISSKIAQCDRSIQDHKRLV